MNTFKYSEFGIPLNKKHWKKSDKKFDKKQQKTVGSDCDPTDNVKNEREIK